MLSLNLALRPELKKGDTVIVAVSGGVDSMVMLHLLHNLGLYDIVVCHMNHLLRETSVDDAAFVKSIAKRLNLKCEVAEDDVSAYAKLKGKSIEDSAREIRYAFLQDMRKKHEASYILTAHHMNDHVETILLHMIRGAGCAGLEGMRRIDRKQRLLRPMLKTTRSDIEAYAEKEHIRHVEDETNRSLMYSRNRVRHTILPQMTKINSGVNDAISRFGTMMAEASDFMRFSALQWLEKEGDSFPVASFRSLHPALRREVIKLMYTNAHGSSKGFSVALCDDAIRLLVRGITNKRVHFGEGLELRIEYDKVVIGKTEAQEHREKAEDNKVMLKEKSRNFEFSVADVQTADLAYGDNPFTALLDYNKLKEKKLYIRYRKNGDAFCPSGMDGKRKKLQDYFVDKKIAANLRDCIPLLVTDDDEIVWVVGMRVDQRFVVEEFTDKILRVDYLGGETI